MVFCLKTLFLCVVFNVRLLINKVMFITTDRIRRYKIIKSGYENSCLHYGTIFKELTPFFSLKLAFEITID
jgi:hypothetical protein